MIEVAKSYMGISLNTNLKNAITSLFHVEFYKLCKKLVSSHNLPLLMMHYATFSLKPYQSKLAINCAMKCTKVQNPQRITA